MTFWVQWSADFLLGFGAMAAIGLASYWILRSDHDFFRLLREVSLFVYGVLAWLALIFFGLVGSNWTVCGLGACGLVFLAALQTPLEQANNVRQLSWGEQFLLALLTHFYFFCNCLVSVLVLAIVGFSPVGFLLGFLPHNSAYLLGIGSGICLTMISISFFRWVLVVLPLRPGLDRALEAEEERVVRDGGKI